PERKLCYDQADFAECAALFRPTRWDDRYSPATPKIGGDMALLIVNLDKMIGNAEAWRAAFAAQLPGLDIRIWPEAGDPKEIEYLAFMRPDFGALPDLPNLKAMFSRSAGVEEFVNHPRLPKVPLGKIEPDGGDPMMTEYTVMRCLATRRRSRTANGCARASCGPRSGISAFSA